MALNIPVAILCGGKGTRLREETEFRPKPMIMVGDRPMIWHIMKIYSHYGVSDFMLCLGYKGQQIREYFLNYDWNHNDVLLELGTKKVTQLGNGHDEQNWKVWLVDTGAETMTGGRLKRLTPHLDKMGSDLFFATFHQFLPDLSPYLWINNEDWYADRQYDFAVLTAPEQSPEAIPMKKTILSLNGMPKEIKTCSLSNGRSFEIMVYGSEKLKTN